MRLPNQCDLLWNRRQRRILATAVATTLAATGLSRGALTSLSGQAVSQPKSIGYIGPVPTQPQIVTPASPFDIAVVGYDVTNTAGVAVNDAAYLVGPYSPTFGLTDTIPNATSDGETATITSSETIGATTTTDKVTLSVPTHFVPVGSTFSDGDLIDEEDLEIGFDAGTTGLQFLVPVASLTSATGTAKYKTTRSATYTFANGDVYTTLADGGSELDADEGIATTSAGAAVDITAYNFSSFSFTFTYPNSVVPEPATGMVGLAIGCLGLLRRRTRRDASPLVPLSSGVLQPGLSTGSALSAACHTHGKVDAGNGSTWGESRLT